MRKRASPCWLQLCTMGSYHPRPLRDVHSSRRILRVRRAPRQSLRWVPTNILFHPCSTHRRRRACCLLTCRVNAVDHKPPSPSNNSRKICIWICVWNNYVSYPLACFAFTSSYAVHSLRLLLLYYVIHPCDFVRHFPVCHFPVSHSGDIRGYQNVKSRSRDLAHAPFWLIFHFVF